MSALEVLQHCPSQCRMLLDNIGIVDLKSSNLIMFNLENYMSRLSHQLDFHVDVVVHNQKIHRTILDEGASTCVMSLSCWKGLKSTTLKKSPMILRALNGKGFHSHWILQSFPIQLGGKTVTVDVKVVDSPLDYNLLLGRSWFYSMNKSFNVYNFLIREKLSLLISWISARPMLALLLPTIFLSWETIRSRMKALVLAY
jgi:hypothetical protein